MTSRLLFSATLIAMLVAGLALSACAQREGLRQRIAEARAASQPDAQEMAERRYITIDGVQRSYVLHDYSGGAPAPVVILLHGGGGNAFNMIRMTGFDDIARREGLIAVYPDGSGGRSDTSLLTWNAGHCCAFAMRENIDDIAFLSALIDRLVAGGEADPSRIYVTGMSNGAMMTHRAGRELSGRIAGIATVVGTVFGDEPPAAGPVPALVINGAADPVVPPEGGILGGEHGGLLGKTLANAADMAAAPAIAQADYWAAANGCTGSRVETKTHYTRTVYADCRAAVEFYLLDGAGHAWPGGQAGREGGDAPVAWFDASEEIWAFFSHH